MKRTAGATILALILAALGAVGCGSSQSLPPVDGGAGAGGKSVSGGGAGGAAGAAGGAKGSAGAAGGDSGAVDAGGGVGGAAAPPDGGSNDASAGG